MRNPFYNPGVFGFSTDNVHGDELDAEDLSEIEQAQINEAKAKAIMAEQTPEELETILNDLLIFDNVNKLASALLKSKHTYDGDVISALATLQCTLRDRVRGLVDDGQL